jgi:thymidylate synthase (FAD)
MEIKLLGIKNKKGLEERIRIVAASGKLSRFPGSVFDSLDSCDDYEKNKKLIERIIKMGHESITDHDYLVFALKDVSPVVEQILIKERIASFTVKSRREVDFGKVGYYIPDFRNNDYEIVPNNDEMRQLYCEHMDSLFDDYAFLISNGINKEDSRFVLPYCYNSNFIMGCDARVLKNLIIKLTKGKESEISEIRELGYKLYEIAKRYVP